MKCPAASQVRLVLAATVAGICVATTVAACGSSDSPDKQVTLLTHDSFSLPQPLLDQFKKETGLTLKTVASGDAGQLASTISLTPGKPKGDAVYGVDNAFASRPVKAGALEPYTPAAASNGPASFSVTPNNELTAIDHADVCVNVDTAWFTAHNQPAPASINDLTDARYRNQMVAMDPATSSPGLGFLLATIASRPGDWQDYWKGLRANQVSIVSGWEQGYNQDFSGGPGKGPKPIVVSYSSSPVDNHATKALLDGCFGQVEYAGVLKGAANPDGAKKVIDFLLSADVQKALPDSMYVYPTVTQTPLPASWAQYAPQPDMMLSLSPDALANRRDDWLKQWRDIMGR